MLTFWLILYHVFLAEVRRGEKSWITTCMLNRECGVVYNLFIKVRGKSLSCSLLFFSTFLYIVGINSQIAPSLTLTVIHFFIPITLLCIPLDVMFGSYINTIAQWEEWEHKWACTCECMLVLNVSVCGEYVHMHKCLWICLSETTFGYYHISVCLSSRSGCLNVSSNH